jgi:hypothetical protein
LGGLITTAETYGFVHGFQYDDEYQFNAAPIQNDGSLEHEDDRTKAALLINQI